FVLLVRVAVHLHDPVRRVEDEELERVERLVDREPDELAVAVLDGRLEDAGVLPADVAVHAVGADDQVVAGEIRRSRSLALVMQDDAELARALLHERNEGRAREGREPVSARGVHALAPVHVDLPPGRALLDHSAMEGLVGASNRLHRLVGEDDAEAVGRPWWVPVPELDVPVRKGFLREDREAEPARPAPEACDVHVPLYIGRLAETRRRPRVRENPRAKAQPAAAGATHSRQALKLVRDPSYADRESKCDAATGPVSSARWQSLGLLAPRELRDQLGA